MVTQLLQQLERPLSRDRLERYRPAGGSDLQLLSNYFWNTELAAALTPVVQTVEVALRNAVHAAATGSYGTEWWFDLPGVVLASQVQDVTVAKQKILRGSRQVTAGRIVAELTFGFWTSLFNRPYESPPYGSSRLSWHANGLMLLRSAFPHLPARSRTRSAVFRRADDARKLRNRIAHCEPLFDRPALWDEHAELLEVVRWIDPSLHDLVWRTDRFRSVYAAQGQTGEAAVRGHLRLY